MLRAVAALACLCLARATPAQTYMRAYAPTAHTPKDLTSILSSIEERLRLLDTVNALQAKQARRLDFIQDRLDRVETTLVLKLDRAQLAAERLEHRLRMIETNVQASINDHSSKIEQTQLKISELAQNLTKHIDTHARLLEKATGAYTDTWRRGLVLEALMRDGLSLVNVTRRELADGLRALARRQRDARMNSADLEAVFSRKLQDNTYKIDLKMQEVLDAQKRFLDSCQRVQQDDPTQVADVLEKLIDSLINKTASTFRELQSIQVTLRNHDTKVVKLLSATRPSQSDTTCRRLESVFRNNSQSTFKEAELQQLTEKFIALTDRADAALQKLEAKFADDGGAASSDVSAAADRLMIKLKGFNTNKQDSDEISWDEEDDDTFFEDGGGGAGDLMLDDRELLLSARRKRHGLNTRTPHRRRLHKHPYDRGPKKLP